MTVPGASTSARSTTTRACSRLPVVRCQRIRWCSLESAQRVTLGDVLFAIFRNYYGGFDRDAFESLFLARRDVVVALLFGSDGSLAGFCSVRKSVYTLSRRYGVFSAGVYVDTCYKGGRVAAMFGLREALRFKCTHPFYHVAYLGFAHTPAPYRLFTEAMPRAYPSRGGEPPADITAVMLRALADRGWSQVGDDPWVRATPMLAREPQWLQRKPELRSNPDVQYFIDRVPGWAQQGHALAVWMPLDLRDIAIATLRMMLPRKKHQSRQSLVAKNVHLQIERTANH